MLPLFLVIVGGFLLVVELIHLRDFFISLRFFYFRFLMDRRKRLLVLGLHFRRLRRLRQGLILLFWFVFYLKLLLFVNFFLNGYFIDVMVDLIKRFSDMLVSFFFAQSFFLVRHRGDLLHFKGRLSRWLQQLHLSKIELSWVEL